MREVTCDIIKFIEDENLLNDRSLSDWQRTILKSTYGMPLSETEMEIYKRGTGREVYDGVEQQEVTVIAGRRGGKTSKVASPTAIFEAFRDHDLPPGETAHVVLLAPTMSQARIAFRSIRNYLRSSPILRKSIRRITKNEIELTNGITICCYPCSYTAVRGITIVAAICDEMAFWPHDESAANPEVEILEALRPGMVTGAKLIKISTPFRKEGLLWDEFQQRSGLDFPVWQAITKNMNPEYSAATLEKAQERDDRKYRREYLAEFSEDVNSWIDPEILQMCVMEDRKELPRMPDTFYLAAVDPGFVHSDFALVIAHFSPNGQLVIDRLERWRGTKKTPVGFKPTCKQVVSILREFDINSLWGDQYCAPIITQELQESGILYEQFTFDWNTRPRIFGNLKHLLNQRKIELPDDGELLRQLRSLDEKKTNRGQVDVRPSGKARDDLAVALALVAYQLVQRPPMSSSLQLGIVERHYGLHLIPERCPLQAICANFPRCLDIGSCQDFKDERVSA